MSEIVLLNKSDNVATCLRDVAQGAVLTFSVDGEATSVEASESIAFGHKVAVRAIAAGESILKYGEVIGRASVAIAKGDWVHIHNIESVRGRGDLS